MNLLISGSREGFSQFDVSHYLMRYCDNSPYNIKSITHGNAKGVDKFAASFCNKCGIKQNIFLPDWGLFGKGAGILRNKEMLDFVLTLEDIRFLGLCYNESKGTIHMIREVDKVNDKFLSTLVVQRGYP